MARVRTLPSASEAQKCSSKRISLAHRHSRRKNRGVKAIEIYTITPNIKLLNLQPPIPGYEKFIGAYLLCGERKAIVDVGPRAAVPNLLSLLATLDISPEEIDYIIPTHIHMDHAGGTGTVIGKMSRARVLAHPRARPHLVDPTLLWKASLKILGDRATQYGEIEPVPENRVEVVTDRMKLDLGGGLVLEIYLTPGHAPHHISLFDRAAGVLIAGEAAGVCLDGAIRLATPPPFKLEDTLSSLDRLTSLQPKKLCYGHFGCYDQVPEKLDFVRHKILEWYEIVQSASAGGRSAEQIFSMLREKDRSLDFLNGLSKAAYDREHDLLLNSIKGLAGDKSESGQ